MKKLYLIGNSHIDPVWLWHWQDGYSEVLATLKINGVEEGMKSYEGVVKILLDYYDGTLFGDVLMAADSVSE